jgi:tRNA-splicing ligase RtcB
MMLHSGSRNIGKTLAEIHIKVAKKLAHNSQARPDKDLSVFLAGTMEMKLYRNDLYWAQDYARLNRLVMLEAYVQRAEAVLSAASDARDDFLPPQLRRRGNPLRRTRVRDPQGGDPRRKGRHGNHPGLHGNEVVHRSWTREPGIFRERVPRGRPPDEPGRGKAVHHLGAVSGADQGRRVPEGRKRPRRGSGAYKDIDQVMENQKDLVEIVAEIKQVLCVKG